MNYTATKCTEDDFERICLKFKLTADDVSNVTSETDISYRHRLLKLFKIWREKNDNDAIVTQQRFIHVIDLVDLPKIVSQLRAIMTYAKATRL
uniref:Death domain-containing protein n=1 Tax=Ciona savignyi TaxID=51511 RepID=H2ZIB8_CIOSA